MKIEHKGERVVLTASHEECTQLLLALECRERALQERLEVLTMHNAGRERDAQWLAMVSAMRTVVFES